MEQTYWCDDVIADKSSRMNSTVYKAILFAYIHRNAGQLKGQMKNDQLYTMTAIPNFLRVKVSVLCPNLDLTVSSSFHPQLALLGQI